MKVTVVFTQKRKRNYMCYKGITITSEDDITHSKT